MVDHFSTYLYQKRGFYYFSRRVPKELHHCHAKHRIVLALNTRSRAKALKYAQVICQRLDERWLPMRLDAIGLGNVIANDVTPLGTYLPALYLFLSLDIRTDAPLCEACAANSFLHNHSTLSRNFLCSLLLRLFLRGRTSTSRSIR